MAEYFSSDIEFLALQNFVLRELHEPVNTGSEAVPVDLVKDKINEVYADAFNDQRMKQSARENNISFNVANDTTLASDVLVGATTLPVTDSSSYLTSANVLLQSEICSYTGNNTGTNTLTGVSPVDINHYSGEVVRQIYPLTTLAADIDAESIQYLSINGIPQGYMGYENLISITNYWPNSYSVYKGNIILSRQATIGGNSVLSQGFLVYTQKVTPMSADADKPALIPNSLRIPILAYGAAMKIAASDAFRTSWDFWEKQYNDALSKYIAIKNNRVRDRNNKRRPTVYTDFRMYTPY